MINTILDLEKIAKENEKCLDEAKLHTQYKIKYVKDYVRRWLNVAVNYKQNNIVFIDSMCNAGIYKNGEGKWKANNWIWNRIDGK